MKTKKTTLTLNILKALKTQNKENSHKAMGYLLGAFMDRGYLYIFNNYLIIRKELTPNALKSDVYKFYIDTFYNGVFKHYVEVANACEVKTGHKLSRSIEDSDSIKKSVIEKFNIDNPIKLAITKTLKVLDDNSTIAIELKNDNTALYTYFDYFIGLNFTYIDVIAHNENTSAKPFKIDIDSENTSFILTPVRAF